MVLTEEQQRWCADKHLGTGFDDDDEDKVQYTHVCEYEGGDGDPPRPVLLENMTRKKRVRIRRALNAWSRKLSHRSYPNAGPRDETAHFHREQSREHASYETKLPKRALFCDGCLKWCPHATRHVFARFGNHDRELNYCRDCCMTGVDKRDYERRKTTKGAKAQKLAYPRQRTVTLCRSPRLWCGNAGQSWPALDDVDAAERARRSAQWADITCVDCVRILRERGCPGIESAA